MKWQQFLISLRGEHHIYRTGEFTDKMTVDDMKEGMSCMRVYRNTDGTWSLMPNWFKGSDDIQIHQRSIATNYESFNDIPEDIQSKISVLLLKEPGGDWLTGVGKRVDDGVFWLEDG